MNIKTPPKHVVALAAFFALLAPVMAGGADNPFTGGEPVEIDFVITAYYSPLPGQCCYVRGGYEAEKVLNGNGVMGADETPVFPGMVASPPSIPFGTRIMLPGIGTVSVHDRGGAIQVWDSGEHRLDLWVGHGEEGLARALAFGVQRVRGTVYPLGTQQPSVSFALESVPTEFKRLDTFMVHGGDLLAVQPALGDRGPSARLLQEHLRCAGYFNRAPTGFFGPETHRSVQWFVQDFGLSVPTDRLTEELAAHILAASYREQAPDPVEAFVEDGAAPSTVMEAQRTLRFLGYYNGRTDGEYSDNLKAAILTFQQDHWLVGTANDSGAGRIGPITKKALRLAWHRELVSQRAKRILDRRTIELALAESGEIVDRFFEEGYSHSGVRTLQTILVEKGFFPKDRISGYFGSVTKEAVLKYQLSRGVVKSASDAGAGRVGPATLHSLQEERISADYWKMRAEGWQVL